MDTKTNSENNRTNKLINYAKATFLPVALAVLFAAQNQVFNSWLDIYSRTYFTRLSLVTFALGIIIYGPALLFKRRYKYIYLLSVSFLMSFIFSAQFLYYRYSESFLQFSAIKYWDQADSVAGTIKILLTPELLVFVSGFFVVLIAFIIAHKNNYAEIILPRWEKSMIILVMGFMAFFGYKYLLDTEKKEWGDTSRLYTDIYDFKSLVGKMGIVNFFVEDTFKYALRSNLISDSDVRFLSAFAESAPKPQASNNYFGSQKGKNIIIIQVESLENAVINTTIAGQEITPNLNKLAKDGLYFNNFYAQVGPGNTADTEFSTMNSLYPLSDGVVFIDYAQNKYSALPELLKNNGYGTYSFHGDVPTFWNRSNIYPGLGYQKSFNLDDFVVTRSVGKGPSDLGDEDLFYQSLPKLESLKQPFLATMITMSSHTPFILPDDLQTLLIPEKTNLTQTQWEYLQSIHYTDKAIGEFIDGLKKDGLYDSSLIFIWGDHGSFTDIFSALAQALPAQAGKNTLPELANSQVPMIILGLGEELNKTTNIPSSQLDVYPTIANLLGITPPESILGQDLLNTKTPVETHFKLVSNGIDAILTENLAYQANNDGVFEHGSCKSMPDHESLPIANCQDLYNQQFDKIKASNIAVRGDLLKLLDKNK